jgi:hypothetical protein
VHSDQELPAFLELESAIQIDGQNQSAESKAEPDDALGDYRCLRALAMPSISHESKSEHAHLALFLSFSLDSGTHPWIM